MNNHGFYVHSRVYTDTFKNQAYTVSLRENTDITTPDLRGASTDFYSRAMARHRARQQEKKAATGERG